MVNTVYRSEIILEEANPMSGVLTPPPPTAQRVCTPRLWCGGGHTRWVKRGVMGQYFGRRQTQLCTLHEKMAGSKKHRVRQIEVDRPGPGSGHIGQG
jgi:hypothetical protein